MDTHGADIIPDVWVLLDKAYEYFGVFPTLLERDFNIPAVKELLTEVQKIKDIQARWSQDGLTHTKQTETPADGRRHSA